MPGFNGFRPEDDRNDVWRFLSKLSYPQFLGGYPWTFIKEKMDSGLKITGMTEKMNPPEGLGLPRMPSGGENNRL